MISYIKSFFNKPHAGVYHCYNQYPNYTQVVRYTVKEVGYDVDIMNYPLGYSENARDVYKINAQKSFYEESMASVGTLTTLSRFFKLKKNHCFSLSYWLPNYCDHDKTPGAPDGFYQGIICRGDLGWSRASFKIKEGLYSEYVAGEPTKDLVVLKDQFKAVIKKIWDDEA